MNVKLLSILSIFFIFVVTDGSGADDVKLVKKVLNQHLMTTLDENRDLFQEKGESIKKPVKTPKKMDTRIQTTISGFPSARRAVTAPSIPMWRTNFLRTMAEIKRLRLMESLYEVIYSYEFFQDPWNRGLRSGQILNTYAPVSDFGQPLLKLNLDQNEDKYFDGWKNRSLFKLLQFRREEIFNEIFMGLRFSFGTKSAPVLVEMNISPFPDKGQGLIIAF